MDSMTLRVVLFWLRLKGQLVKQLELSFVRVGGNYKPYEIEHC